MRVLYRLYQTESTAATLRSHAVEGQVAAAFAYVDRVTLRAQRQWGENLRGMRIQVGFARRF